MTRFVFIALVFCACIASIPGSCQVPVYRNYGVKEGLAGSTVHYAFQDKQGFMWFCTDQGLSRFDGTNFRTYTTRDGLTDNEVFMVAEDSMGRLWMLCYNSKLCFMQQGIVHNPDNDTLLRKIDYENQLFTKVNIDKQGRVWILGVKVHMVDGNQVMKFDAPGEEVAIALGEIGGRFAMVTVHSVYGIELQGYDLSYQLIAKTTLSGNNSSSACFINNECFICGASGGKGGTVVKVTADTLFKAGLSSLGILDMLPSYSVYNPFDSVFLTSGGLEGIKAFDLDLNVLPDPYPFLPNDVSYSHTFFDNEGNTWITSLGRGVFLLPAQRILKYNLGNKFRNAAAISVYGVESENSYVNEKIYVGFDYSQYAVLQYGKLMQYVVPGEFSTRNRVVKFSRIADDAVMVGTDYGTYILRHDDPSDCRLIEISCVKDLVNEGKDSVLVGGSGLAYRVVRSTGTFHIDTLWGSRTTAILRDHSGKTWFGSVNGLFTSLDGKVVRFDKNENISKSRIMDLVCDEYGNIWVATHQRGLYVITADSIVTINSGNGLPSDVCVRIFPEADGIMWVGTHRHVVKITYSHLDRFRYDISTLRELSGETDVVVNDIYVDSGYIWLAASDGLLQIEKTTPNAVVPPPVYITSFKCADSAFTVLDAPRLRYFQNNIQIDYVGISYNSAGKMVYKYLMNSFIDTIYTTNTSVSLSSLQPGKYFFKVWAKNITGGWSAAPAMIAFQIAPPFWKSWWFIVSLLLAGVVAVWLSVKYRIEKIRMQEQEKTSINKKIAEVELQAVRAQMNEHFIFNSLNSIQNFINQNDTEAANFYLANFGKLIRRTLDISTMPSISLQEEIDYLTTYLTLEKMRFSDKFDYFILNRIPHMSADHIIFPSMILQPYVENAIRHGLRHKEEGTGKLEISFNLEDEFIVCRIADNGIGRKKARELKNRFGADHQSKGTKLSEDRVYLFNRVNSSKIRIEVEDIDDIHKNVTGTIVKIYVPLKTLL